jgi:hypothetical protein
MTETAVDGLTLRRILFEEGSDAELRGAMDRAGTTESVEERLAALPARLRAIALDEIVGVIERVLDDTVVDVLAAGWRKWDVLAAAGRLSLESPGQTEIVELVDHRITSTHHPAVDVTVDGVQVAEITLQIEIVILLHALTAVVTQGRLVALRSGRGELSVNLALDGVPLTSATRQIELPIGVELGEGIPLVPAAETAIMPPAPAGPSTTG